MKSDVGKIDGYYAHRTERLNKSKKCPFQLGLIHLSSSQLTTCFILGGSTKNQNPIYYR